MSVFPEPSLRDVIRLLENNGYYRIKVFCEPQLGKRGLYPSISKKGSYDAIKSMTNFIAYADGKHDLIWIADKIHVPASELYEIKDKLLAHDLLEEIEG